MLEFLLSVLAIVGLSTVCAIYSGIYHDRMSIGNPKEKLGISLLLVISFVSYGVSFELILDRVSEIWNLSASMQNSSWLFAIPLAALLVIVFERQGTKQQKAAIRPVWVVINEIITERTLIQQHLNRLQVSIQQPLAKMQLDISKTQADVATTQKTVNNIVSDTGRILTNNVKVTDLNNALANLRLEMERAIDRKLAELEKVNAQHRTAVNAILQNVLERVQRANLKLSAHRVKNKEDKRPKNPTSEKTSTEK